MIKNITQEELVMEFFRNNPKKNIKHTEIIDWVTEAYEERTGKKFRDPDRQIRKLHQHGSLIKISKGVYKYDPDNVDNKELEVFSEKQKQEILQRDDHKCVICGKGKKDGVELQIDHIKPKDKGGKATIANGQTLCAPHNFMKKGYKQTESGKKMFIRLYEAAKEINDTKTIIFCTQILEVYKYNNINGHIEWEK